MQPSWVYFLFLAIAVAVAAAVSWHLAARQKRKVKAWVIWTLLLGGLPAIYLVISEIFERPRLQPGRQEPCCNANTWSPLTGLGHAGSYDFRLGECSQCGKKLMESSYYGMTYIAPITETEAKRFLTLKGDELKWALKKWHG